jgi:uncharacterized protein YifN (PemK superfamily)
LLQAHAEQEKVLQDRLQRFEQEHACLNSIIPWIINGAVHRIFITGWKTL